MTATLYFGIYSLLLSQLPFPFSFVCVRILHLLELLLQELFFYPPQIYNDNKNNIKTKRREPRFVSDAIILRDKHPGFCSYLSPGLLSRLECFKMAAKRPAHVEGQKALSFFGFQSSASKKAKCMCLESYYELNQMV